MSVLLKEFRSLISNIYAILTAAIFSIASGILFTVYNLVATYPSIDAVVTTMSFISAILIPVIACFSINGEKKKGTDALLGVLPVTRTQIVLGKFFGILAFLMIPTGIMFIYPIIAGLFGDPLYLYSYIVLLIFVVFEAFVVALSLMLSSVFKKGWVAIAVTYGVLIVLFLLGSLSVLFPGAIRDICTAVSPFRQFDKILFGVLDISALAYFLLLTVLFLVITVLMVSRRRRADARKKLTAVVAAVAVVALALNIATALLPVTIRWIDVSSSGLYTTGKVTEELIDQLDEEITVYLLDSDGSEQKLLNALEHYCDMSDKITLKEVNTAKDPEFREKYGLSEEVTLSYCLVVESARRWRFISSDTLFVWYNSNTGYMSSADYASTVSSLETMINQYYPYYSSMSSDQQSQLDSYITLYDSLLAQTTQCLDVENVLSAGIEYVTAEHIPTFYFLTGHGEKNTQGGPLDIRGLSKIPQEAAMLVLNNPTEDYTEAEVDMLIDFMQDGGRMIVFTGKNNNSMPNLAKLLASAGLSLEPDALPEGNSKATVNTSTDALALLAGTEKVTLDIIGGDSIITDESNTALKYTSLFSFDIEVEEEVTNDAGETETKTKVVTKNLGVAVTNGSEPMLVWLTGADTFNRDQTSLSDEELQQYATAMYGVSSLIVWMGKSFESSLDPIDPTVYVPAPLTIEQKDVTFGGVVVIGLIPLILIGVGLLRIYSRKNRSRRAAVQDK